MLILFLKNHSLWYDKQICRERYQSNYVNTRKLYKTNSEPISKSHLIRFLAPDIPYFLWNPTAWLGKCHYSKQV